MVRLRRLISGILMLLIVNRSRSPVLQTASRVPQTQCFHVSVTFSAKYYQGYHFGELSDPFYHCRPPMGPRALGPMIKNHPVLLL